MPRTAAQSDARIRELEALLSERIASHEVCIGLVQELREKLERAEAECAELRGALVRARSFIIAEATPTRARARTPLIDIIDAALAAQEEKKYPRVTEPPAAPVPNQGWGKRRKPKAGA